MNFRKYNLPYGRAKLGSLSRGEWFTMSGAPYMRLYLDVAEERLQRLAETLAKSNKSLAIEFSASRGRIVVLDNSMEVDRAKVTEITLFGKIDPGESEDEDDA
jgi:hypothetical protein